MRISANDFVALLKKLDEVEDKAGIASSSYSQEDHRIMQEKIWELRQALYSVLASSEDSAWKGEEAE